MSPRSLVFRLVSAAAVMIALALTLAGFGLSAIFQKQIEHRAGEELTQTVKVLVAQVRISPEGALHLDVALADPRFGQPYGGLYWQIDGPANRRLRSRSLWDFVLTAPPQTVNRSWRESIEGPSGTRLLAVGQEVVVDAGGRDVALRVIAALDRSDLAAAQRSFLALLIPSLATLGVVLVSAMAVFIRLALRPFRALGHGLRDIRTGKSSALEGRFPDEVQPMVDDLNRLIAFQERAVARARAQAADMAHGLKTPLAVLGAMARQAQESGRADLAAPLAEQVEAMEHQVSRTLARARANLAGPLRARSTAIAPVAEKVVRTLQRVSDDEKLQWDIDIPAHATFPGDDGDLVEILGNLADNARKWAKARVRVTATATPVLLTVAVEDDGPGLSEEQRAQIARGRRWDESRPGTGFGLAITRDLVEAYRGSLTLERGTLGGLRAAIAIPLTASEVRSRTLSD